LSGTLSQDLASRGSISGTVRFVGTRDDINFNAPTATTARVVLPGYTTVDVAGEFGITPASAGGRGASLTVRVSNLLNRQYDEV
jgi:outer membrane receptor protein involved in Fe transport